MGYFFRSGGFDPAFNRCASSNGTLGARLKLDLSKKRFAFGLACSDSKQCQSSFGLCLSEENVLFFCTDALSRGCFKQDLNFLKLLGNELSALSSFNNSPLRSG